MTKIVESRAFSHDSQNIKELTMTEQVTQDFTNTEKTNRKLIQATHWPRYHDWPPIGGLRHLIFYAESNGFDKVIKRVGRRVLIDEDKFFEFVNDQSSKGIKK